MAIFNGVLHWLIKLLTSAHVYCYVLRSFALFYCFIIHLHNYDVTILLANQISTYGGTYFFGL